MRKLVMEFVPGLVGGVVGGFLGYLTVGYVMRTGFWIPVLPGAFAGFACGQLSSVSSTWRGAINGVLALAMSIYAQWKLFNPPFSDDYTGSFPSYVGHLHQLPPLTLVLLVLNGILGFWWGREQRMGSSQFKPKAGPPREV